MLISVGNEFVQDEGAGLGLPYGREKPEARTLKFTIFPSE